MEKINRFITQGFMPESAEWLQLWRHLRHDFVNQIQVILGYIQMGKPELGTDYARSVASKLQEAGNVMAVGFTSVTATLVLKSFELEREGILLRTKVAQDWDPSLWQDETKARTLAVTALELTESLMPLRDTDDEEPVLCLNFTGGSEPSLEAFWLGYKDSGVTRTLSHCLA